LRIGFFVGGVRCSEPAVVFDGRMAVIPLRKELVGRLAIKVEERSTA
jgi:hypothetical protein